MRLLLALWALASSIACSEYLPAGEKAERGGGGNGSDRARAWAPALFTSSSAGHA